ncbi:alpha/beta hydrolase [bacterium]|nr:alpha/beta hydrolase [bacterium]
MSARNTSTTSIVTVPCFSGAPWELDQLTPLADYDLRTMRLPDERPSIEEYADFVEARMEGLKNVVLVGDSFGAVIALAVAVRQPENLRALVLSGGFAANPVTDPLTRIKLGMSRFLPGPLYRQAVLRFHAASLASPHDATAEIHWNAALSRQLFLENTPWRSYVTRARAAFSADYRDRLERINVPALILTPSHDELIGEDAARIMLEGIADAREEVLEGTGHMFRFTHPEKYAGAIRTFLDQAEMVQRSNETKMSSVA